MQTSSAFESERRRATTLQADADALRTQLLAQESANTDFRKQMEEMQVRMCHAWEDIILLLLAPPLGG